METNVEEEAGVWVACDYEREVVPFQDEVSALRYAVDNYMHVKFVPFGRSVREADG